MGKSSIQNKSKIFLGLETIKNGEKHREKQKEIFPKTFVQKNHHFWLKLGVFGQKFPFLDKMDIFWVDEKPFLWPNFLCHVESQFNLSYAHVAECMVRLTKNAYLWPKTSCFG